jgi:CO dehydrogenase/acetyl-CoA synthase gamma subunit (corrinoid Fe-S protein)
MESASGRIPRIKTALSVSDLAGTIMTRIGINRNHYKVAPGLYGVGNPGPDSPVLVTANYKLSFDAVRKELKHTHAWLLVLDTRGINVWCAAYIIQSWVKGKEAASCGGKGAACC